MGDPSSQWDPSSDWELQISPPVMRSVSCLSFTGGDGPTAPSVSPSVPPERQHVRPVGSKFTSKVQQSLTRGMRRESCTPPPGQRKRTEPSHSGSALAVDASGVCVWGGSCRTPHLGLVLLEVLSTRAAPPLQPCRRPPRRTLSTADLLSCQM